MDTDNLIFWLVKQIGGFLASCFFLIMGIQVLIRAYKVGDPFNFLVLFFSSNFMILLSLTMGGIFAYRLYRYWQETGPDSD